MIITEETGVLASTARISRADQQRPHIHLMTNTLETGGSERQFLALAGCLQQDHFRVSMSCLKRKGSLMRGIQGIAEFDLGGSFLSLRAQHARVELGRALRSQHVDIAHSFDFYSNLMLIPSARLAGTPVVIGCHRQIGDLLTPLQFAVQNLVFRLCDRVVCNSEAAAERLIDHGLPESKVTIIRNGLRSSAYADAVPALPERPGWVRIGLIARMNHPVKNHSLFLRAAARLTHKFPSLEFLLVGDGPLRQELETVAAKLGLGPQAIFLGERDDIAEVLAAMDISVLPSSSESLSNVILESMAAGLPVVASRVGGNTELVRHGETGLLVPPDDEDRLVDAMECFILQPDFRQECGRRAMALARKDFGLERMRDQHEQLYLHLLELKRPRLRWLSPPQPRGPGQSTTTRVSIVAASPAWIGGHSVQAELLTRCWQNDPTVVANFIPIDPALPRPLEWVGRIPYLRTILREPLYLARLWRGIRDADIVHVFSASYWSFLLTVVPAWLISRLRGKKLLVNYHSGEAEDHLRRWRSARFVLNHVDSIVVPSEYLATVFQEFGLRAQPVPNVVDVNRFTYRPRQPLRPRLLCTRGFELYYRVDLVVRAFARLKERFPDSRLCLVGKGSQEKLICALVRELNAADVEFTGPVSRQKIGSFYDRSDIFINASYLDNMPISILEAFASGTPVVTTAPEGIQFLVEHERTGLLCAPSDWQALAENVVRLLMEPGLASRLAQNAHEELRHYQWEAVREKWLEVYHSLRAQCDSTAQAEE
jgi:glycosyltransferase involved in cell wall biosynthesis